VRWRGRFLRALRQTPSVKHACAAAGIDRATAYRHRKEDADFAAKWEDAIQASVDELEYKAFQLAIAGDSNLITFLLRCHKPEVYRDTQRHEVGLLGGIVLLPPKEKGAE
jgi:GAF domain-containing protein